jgi:alpha-ketoglutarate-dependent taurine dioxygenase
MSLGMEKRALDQRLKEVFGDNARCETPLARSGAGVRFTGIDLWRRLSGEQVEFLLEALSHYRMLCFAGQALNENSLGYFERFANHWGAPIPHPSNFMRGGKPAQQDGASDGAMELIPYENRKAAVADATLPGVVQCLPHTSPAVLIATNLRGKAEAGGAQMLGGESWHTDVEYEKLPIYVSMFLVHHMPVARDATGGTWVTEPDADMPDRYFEGSGEELMRLRKQLPLNGETAYADTAAAFAALSTEEQSTLESVQLRRRLNDGDEGWLAPMVRVDPRSGVKSLHSPVWASRPGIRPPVEVDGMSMEESRAFLDRLEAHVLQPVFRYDHLHVPGDVTIWNNFMSIHNTPPTKTNIGSIDDARLLYRLSSKGEPALTLPRRDDPEWLAAHVAGGYSTPLEIIDIEGA